MDTGAMNGPKKEKKFSLQEKLCLDPGFSARRSALILPNMERLPEFLLYTFFIVIILIIIHFHDYLKLFLVCPGFGEACILVHLYRHKNTCQEKMPLT